jgi:hypothetical protein
VLQYKSFAQGAKKRRNGIENPRLKQALARQYYWNVAKLTGKKMGAVKGGTAPVLNTTIKEDGGVKNQIPMG